MASASPWFSSPMSWILVSSGRSFLVGNRRGESKRVSLACRETSLRSLERGLGRVMVRVILHHSLLLIVVPTSMQRYTTREQSQSDLQSGQLRGLVFPALAPGGPE